MVKMVWFKDKKYLNKIWVWNPADSINCVLLMNFKGLCFCLNGTPQILSNCHVIKIIYSLKTRNKKWNIYIIKSMNISIFNTSGNLIKLLLWYNWNQKCMNKDILIKKSGPIYNITSCQYK